MATGDDQLKSASADEPRDGAPVLAPTFVVGIVASAGGLEALSAFFGPASPDCPLAFIVIEHLSRTAESLLPALLARRTSLSVVPAVHGETLAAGHVYVIQPNTFLGVKDGALVVRAAEELARTELPGDHLFASIAEAFHDRAVGVVLSGGGQDGSAGARAIKRSGGRVFAQSPATAEHKLMPESAIATSTVDVTLPPDKLLAEIIAVTAPLPTPVEDSAFDADISEHIAEVCAAVQRATGHDFTGYKGGTLHRRIRRRMREVGAANADDYVRYMAAAPDEAALLLKELLIGVTRFFRDPEVFTALAEQIVPSILESVQPESAVRVWVPGCATGEEAYSIAILVHEELARRGEHRPVQLFATDIDVHAIQVARAGRYSDDALAQVSDERKSRFFERSGNAWIVHRELREACVFSTQDLVRDPPFSSLDLISCRNVLIYLQPDLQTKLLPIFHYALRHDGYLLLGPSEGLAASIDLFEPIDRAKRLFRRRDMPTRPINFSFRHATSPRTSPEGQRPVGERSGNVAQRAPAIASFERSLLEEFTHASAAIDARGDVHYVAGRLGRYLRQPAGVPTNNLFDQLRGTLRSAVRNLVEQSSLRKRRVAREGVLAETDDGTESVRVTVWPVSADGAVYGVVIQRLSVAAPPSDPELALGDEQPILEQLENDLRATRAELQCTIEELESANEELQSSNEELQSSNEELHTSQEELQSVNEELETVNAELQAKVQEVNAVNSDLKNLFASGPVATVFLDRELRIMRFTPSAQAIFDFIDADVGRPITHLAARFSGADYAVDSARVLATSNQVEREVQSLDGKRQFILRTQPYQSVTGDIAGVVTTFVDVTALKAAEADVRLRSELLQLSFDAILVWRLGGIIELWNRGAGELYGYADSEAIGRSPHELLHTVFPDSWERVERELRTQGRWAGIIEHKSKSGAVVIVSAKLLFVRGADGIERVFETNRDITKKTAVERALREGDERLRLVNESAGIVAFEIDLAARSIRWFAPISTVGPVPDPTDSVDGLLHFIHSEDAPRVARAFTDSRLTTHEGRHREEFRWSTDRDNVRWGQVIVQRAYDDTSGAVSVRRARGVMMDVTARKQAEGALATADKLHALGVLAGGIAHDFNNLLMGLYGLLQLVRYQVDRPTFDRPAVRHYLDEALQSYTRATALSRQLLTFAKGGGPKESSGPLEPVVRSAVAFALTGSNVVAKFAFDAQCPPCSFDPEQISRVFENITLNARQAMAAGGVVEVDGHAVDVGPTNTLGVAPGAYVVVSVRDAGAGITKDRLPRIFDPFFTTKPTGNGLGLATVHSIVRQHAGAIEVDSTLGVGTTFRVYIPVGVLARARSSAALSAPAAVGGRILLMDDDPTVRDVLCGILETLGCEVITATEGGGAIDALRSEMQAGRRFDAALLDLTIAGGMSGKDAALAIKSLDPSVPLIAISGYSDDPILANPGAYGFADGIAKPMTQVDLARTLARALHRSEPPRPRNTELS